MEANFSGWATKNDLVCSDGRTIKSGAFQHHDKQRVPLVWQHMHDDPDNVLGHAILENRPEGVYAYGFFNETEKGQNARLAVEHGDVVALSIFANGLRQQGKSVLHGNIREVSLVLAGANPGAMIENVNIRHADGGISQADDEAVIHTGAELSLAHEDTTGDDMADTAEKTGGDKTVKEIYDTLTEEQQTVVGYLVSEALSKEGESSDEDDKKDNEGSDTETLKQSAIDSIDKDELAHSVADNILDKFKENPDMARNLFESRAAQADAMVDSLTHDQLSTIVEDAKRNGSLRDAFLAHAGDFGIDNIDVLFPDAKALTDKPELIARQAEWVPKVLGGTKHTPFSKIKSIVADLTPEAARAKGYVKGNLKKEEVFALLKRTTGPTTIYKKQKLDRDDIIDITELDVVAWLKWEIRFMLNEELARAILVGDGRSAGDEDKIKDPMGSNDGTGIRSIANDHDMYAHKVQLAANVSNDVLIDEITRARTAYRGSGSPSLYTTDKVLTDLMLLKDKMGRRLYNTESELAAALRVKEIVPVEVLEETPSILAIIVNLMDYSVGANKGGELSFFEDFDIDYNQNKYLLETRVSGALTKPKSAIVVRRDQGTSATPAAPSFNGSTNTITIPTTTGVNYTIAGDVVTGSQSITEDTTVEAEAAEGYYIPAGSTTSWTFTYTEA